MSLPNVTTLHILSVIVFWGQIQNYMMRVNLNILIVEMVKGGAEGAASEAHQVRETCIVEEEAAVQLSPVAESGGEFDWGEATRGLILASFSIGYTATQVLGGRAAELYGARRVYGGCLFLCGLLCFVSPVAARLHPVALCAVRVLQGACEGVTFPALHALTARWVPVDRRGSFIARSYFGSTFGLILTYPLCGWLADWFSWDAAFYVTGAATCIWFATWLTFVYDSPREHPSISPEERDELLAALGPDEPEVKPPLVPWRAIARSLPFYGLCATDAANTWGMYIMATSGPTYLRLFLGLDLGSTGVLSALPWLCRYAGCLVHAAIADHLLSSSKMRLVNIRKLFNSTSQCVPALTMALVAFSGCNPGQAVALQCAGFFFNGALAVGHMSSHMDLAPNFAGTLFGISNTFSGGATGWLAPLFVGLVTQDNMTLSAWRNVFLSATGVYLLGNVVYVLLISGEVQTWNQRREDNKEAS